MSADGTNFTQVSSGAWAQSGAQKQASFSADGVRYVRLVGVQGGNGYISAAEVQRARHEPAVAAMTYPGSPRLR